MGKRLDRQCHAGEGSKNTQRDEEARESRKQAPPPTALKKRIVGQTIGEANGRSVAANVLGAFPPAA